MLFDYPKNIFGLDISERALRLIQLKKKGKKLIISSFNETKLAEGIIISGEIKSADKMAMAIKKLVAKAQGNKITARDVVAVLPEPKTFIKVIEVTLKEEVNMVDAIKEEIKNHIPLELEKIYLDWQILSQSKNRVKILVGATPKDISDSYFTTIKKAGLTPLSLEIEAIAIIRALIKKNKEKKQARMIIDFGAIRTGLIIYDQGIIQFTVSLPVSGIKITQTIAKILNLDPRKAEKAKIVCGLDEKKCEGALLKILMSNINNLSTHIKKSITFYKTNFSKGNEISEIILCGGGANLDQIDRVLTERIKIPVKIGNPAINLSTKKGVNIPNHKLLSYTTAIGLALRAWQKGRLI